MNGLSTADAVKQQENTNHELFETLTNGATLAEKARAVANALFATGHNEALPRNIYTSNMSLLSGSAVAILFECAKALEAQEGK